ELLVGHHASAGSRRAQPPPAPSTIVPDVHPQLERVIMQALSLGPENRQASAAEFAAGLPDIGVWRDEMLTPVPATARPARMPWWIPAAGLAAIVALIAVVSSHFTSPAGGTLTEQDTI